MFGSALQDVHNCPHRSLDGLMLPDPDNLPACIGQGSICRSVTFDIPAELRCPVPLVGRRLSAMYGANMPEATINEHSDFPSREHDVWPDLHRADLQAKVFAIAVPQPMQCAAKRYLRLGISATIRLHVPRPTLVERGGVEAAFMRRSSGSFCLVLSHIHTGCTRNHGLRKDTLNDWPGRRRPQHRKASL